VDDGVGIDEMDADIETTQVQQHVATQDDGEEEDWDGTEEMRKRVLQKYMDEVYQMDFNDVVAGIPTRFKYTPVPNAHFSLSAADILMATDKELNEYVGMKVFAPHKKRASWDRSLAPKLGELKRSLAKREWGFAGLNRRNGTQVRAPMKKRKGDGEVKVSNRRKGKRERERERLEAVETSTIMSTEAGGAAAPEPAEELPQKKKRKRNKSKRSSGVEQ